jgi:hypothetical protein
VPIHSCNSQSIPEAITAVSFSSSNINTMASNHCSLQQQHSQLNGSLHLCLCRSLHTQNTTTITSNPYLNSTYHHSIQPPHHRWSLCPHQINTTITNQPRLHLSSPSSIH